MRYFVNKLADFVPGSRVQVDHAFWKQYIVALANKVTEHMPPTFDNCDGGLYVGCGGLAYMFYYLAESEPFADMRQEMLTRARNYLDVSLSYAASKRCRDPPASFLLGPGGVYATGSLIYRGQGDANAAAEMNRNYLSLSAVCQPVDFLSCGSDELFVGRAGYLCGALLLNRKCGEV